MLGFTLAVSMYSSSLTASHTCLADFVGHLRIRPFHMGVSGHYFFRFRVDKSLALTFTFFVFTNAIIAALVITIHLASVRIILFFA